MTDRYRHTDLQACARALFANAGVEPVIAAAMADILVDADLLGYDTHGLAFAPPYVAGIEAGRTACAGEPEVLGDRGGALRLDGRGLPGQWATLWALERACERVGQHGIVAVTLRGVQNISCLATYVKRAAERGLLGILTASAPGGTPVAPHGGRAGRMSTNPFAVGIPTDGHPVLIDTSSAASSNRQAERHRRAGTRLPHPAFVTAAGAPSDDPEAFLGDPPGAILPGGGVAFGHKGFAMGLTVEALTSGLIGWGRADKAAGAAVGGGNNVYLQVIDPEAFGGLAALQREAGFLARSCREAPPLAGGPPVRVPGDRALALYAKQVAEGVTLHPEIMPRLAPLLAKYEVPPPAPLA